MRHLSTRALPPAALAAAVLLFAACGGGSAQEPSLTASPTALATPAATPTPASGAPTPTPGEMSYRVKDGDTIGGIAELFGVEVEALIEANQLPDETSISIGQVLVIPGVTATPRPTPGPTTTSTDNLLGMHLIMPLAGACLTPENDQMPNVPREYRAGIHEGVDFFTSYACIDVPKGLPELAVADGTIIRADQDYRQLTQQEIEVMEAESAAQGYTSEGTLDKFRGRQVWIDHGNGIVTRYAHLSGMPADIVPGKRVKQGDVIGYVGDSGTPESASNPDFVNHLHFEIRVGDSYLGAGLSPEETRAVYEAVWGITHEETPAP